MNNIAWLLNALIMLGVFVYFILMLNRVQNVKYYNYLTGLLAASVLMFSVYFTMRFIELQIAELFQFVLVFLLLIFSLVQFRRVVLGHEFY